MKIGMRIGKEYLNIYPKKLGMVIPASSEMDFTIKLGAFPMYVVAPINTAPAEIASSVVYNSPISWSASPPAVLKNTR